MHSIKKRRKWLIGGTTGLKPLPYWPFNREKRQFYFVDSDGKQIKCRRNLVSIMVRRVLKIWKR